MSKPPLYACLFCLSSGPVLQWLPRYVRSITVLLQISGWLYFLTWSLSFYPQFLLNWRTKSVVGLSFDYVSLNMMGFIGYSIFNIAFYFDSSVQEQYRYSRGALA